MLGGMDPAKLMEARKAGKHLTATVSIDKNNGTFTVQFIPTTEEGKQLAKQMANDLAHGVMTQVSTFFAIKGSLKNIS